MRSIKEMDKRLDEREQEIERLKIIEEKYKDSQLYIHDFKEEIERLKSNEKTLADLLNKEQKKNKKAIEFIYENAYSEDRKELVDELWYEIPELVAILKGEDKE